MRGRTSDSIACKSRRSEEHTSELQSQSNLVCRLLLEKKKGANPRNPDERTQPIKPAARGIGPASTRPPAGDLAQLLLASLYPRRRNDPIGISDASAST